MVTVKRVEEKNGAFYVGNVKFASRDDADRYETAYLEFVIQCDRFNSVKREQDGEMAKAEAEIRKLAREHEEELLIWVKLKFRALDCMTEAKNKGEVV